LRGHLGRARQNGLTGTELKEMITHLVTFSPVSEIDAGTQAAVNAAYHGKYDPYGQQIVGTVTGAHAAPVTLRLVPQDAS
jgi:hypothetical protein